MTFVIDIALLLYDARRRRAARPAIEKSPYVGAAGD